MKKRSLFLAIFCLCLSCGTPSQISSVKVRSIAFLDSLSVHTFHYFWDLANPKNGQIPDRWPTKSFSSIAATGFGLTTYLVGVERGYISREQAATRVLTTLTFLNRAPKGDAVAGISGYKGFFYHFLDSAGLRFPRVELSTMDTGLLMAGILSAQSFFDQQTPTEQHIRSVSDSLFLAVEWDWAMNGTEVMSMGWFPDSGFIKANWRGYNEAMILYIMALGSPTHAIPAESWKAWTKTYQWGTYFNQEHINFGPLFGHQYSHMYIDFSGIQDDYTRQKQIDYFINSRMATYANRAYCMSNPKGYVGYGKDIWGLTACDGPGNRFNVNPNISFMDYSARGAAQWYAQDDGTIAPTAAGGSIPFAPEICIPALMEMKNLFGARVYGQYGFKDAFNLSITKQNNMQGWFDSDYLGIDQGPIVIQIENYKSGFVWNLMKKNKHIVDGLRKAGFSGGWLN